MAFAYSGSLTSNPLVEPILTENGETFQFTPPTADELPQRFADSMHTYQAPPIDPSSTNVLVDPDSQQLQLLQPFAAWDQKNAQGMSVLVKVRGKCTTDHISPAGPWYRYRGHLENISNNLLTAAENAFLGPGASRGMTISDIDGQVKAIPTVARAYRDASIKWCIIGDSNYGEGSSREHAALEPRFLGGVAVIAKSFARIHETNLKKQGMLPLTFDDPTAYDRIEQGDKVSILDVSDMRPGEPLVMKIESLDGRVWETRVNHTYHIGQLPWLMCGSALNHIKQQKI